MNYLDFDLEIGPGVANAYPLAVLRSPAGEARETMQFPFSERERENQLLSLQDAILASEQQAVQDFGVALFEALMTGEVRSRFDVSLREAVQQGSGLRLRLRIRPPELAALPWEFLYDPRQAEYLCLSRETPVVRYLELPRPVQPLAVRPPLQILGMVANPEDLDPPLNVAREKQRLDEAIRDLEARGLVTLTWLEGQTARDLQRALRRGPWHVFHFIGHGGFDPDQDEGYLALVDEDGWTVHLSATQLGRLLANHGSLRLALLNSCEGGRGGAQDVFSSSAAILLRRGIPAVLAMQYEITDYAAIELSRTFYESLADGMPVDAALVEARTAISVMVENTAEWGTPVLYMRAPNGELFDVEGQEPSTTPADAAAPAIGLPRQPRPTAARFGSPDQAEPQVDRTKLRQLLIDSFDAGELRDLCFDLEVDYDSLRGEGKAGKARELIAHLERRRRVADLLQVGREARPELPWDDVLVGG